MKDQGALSTAATRAIETLRAVLADIGWKPREDPETAGFIVDFDPPYIPMAYAYAVISADMELFVYYLHFGLAAAANRRDETAKFLTLANWNLMSGNFEMDFDDGVLRFRSSVCFRGAELSESLIRNAILLGMNAVERYADAAIDVMARGKSAEQAYKELMTTED